jgi:hypothetical protein
MAGEKEMAHVHSVGKGVPDPPPSSEDIKVAVVDRAPKSKLKRLTCSPANHRQETKRISITRRRG